MSLKTDIYSLKDQHKIKFNVFFILFTSMLLVDYYSIIHISNRLENSLIIHFLLTTFWHGAFCLLLTLPLAYIKKFKIVYSITILLLFIPPSLIEFLHLVIYGAVFHESSYITLTATNNNITYDFFYTYTKWYHIIVILIYLLVLVLILKLKLQFSKPSKRILIITLIVFTPFVFRFNLNYIKSIPTFRMIKVWVDYKKSYNDLLNQTNIPIDKKSIIKDNKLGKELHVIVIGESTSASHMGLYGYTRNTNPLLIKIKNDLIIFNNVHTDKVHTIESLKDVFTFSLINNKTSTLIDVFNASGYHTFWLSNQPYFEESITPVTIISKRSNDSKFLDPINFRGTDARIINPFKDLIRNVTNDKQIIIVHLKGTHTPYEKYYPKKFNQFKGGNSKFGNHANEIINHYDNAILYNDYIISRLINIVKSKTDYAVSLTYFSDHGDEVYDKRDYFGHNQALLPSTQMTHVPCFIWLNERMKKNSTITNGSFNSPKKLKNISNTLLDLYQIEFKPIPKTDSYFIDKK